MTLKTRKPTGAVPWPLILLEGGEKSGKTYACAVLTASAKVGRSAWLDLGEGSADEYGAIPGTRYEVIEHDGTWQSIIGQVADAKAEAKADAEAGKPPFVLIVDTMTAEWEMLKDWASDRAKLTDSNKAKLRADPNAEIKVATNFWNDAGARHRRLMTMLMTFPGIVVVTARGKDVTAMDDKGQPIQGTKEYRVESHKTLAYDASCWVRMYRDKPAIVVGARSVHAGLRPGKDKPRELDADWTLEGVIFDVLQCDPAKARVRNLAELRTMRPAQEIRDEALATTTDFARIKELYAEAAELGYGDGDTVVTDTQELEPLLKFLLRVGREKKAAETPQRPALVREAPAAGLASVPAAAVQAKAWLDEVASASYVDTLDKAGCLALWNESAAKFHAGEITKADAARVQKYLTARIEDLDAEANEARLKATALEDDDPWAVKIEAVTSSFEAEGALEEVGRQLAAQVIDAERAARISAAIRARFPQASADAVAA